MPRKGHSRLASPARERILDAALDCFAEKGFSGSSTKEIARRAKVNEVTIFRIFKSKRALFVAVLGERSPMVSIKEKVSLEARGSLEELLEGNIRTVLKMLRSNKQIYYVVMADAWRQPKMRSLAYEEIVKRGIGFVASFMKRLMDEGKIRSMDPDVAARGLMGAVQFYFLTTEIMGGGTPKPDEEERVIRGFVSIFLNGMKVESGG